MIVVQKLYDLGMKTNEIDIVVVHLLQNDFLNEERFSRSFARGKHRIKKWGKIRIVNELKQRHIAAPNIKLALTEISEEQYQETFHTLAEKHWEILKESDGQKRKRNGATIFYAKAGKVIWFMKNEGTVFDKPRLTSQYLIIIL